MFVEADGFFQFRGGEYRDPRMAKILRLEPQPFRQDHTVLPTTPNAFLEKPTADSVSVVVAVDSSKTRCMEDAVEIYTKRGEAALLLFHVVTPFGAVNDFAMFSTCLDLFRNGHESSNMFPYVFQMDVADAISHQFAFGEQRRTLCHNPKEDVVALKADVRLSCSLSDHHVASAMKLDRRASWREMAVPPAVVPLIDFYRAQERKIFTTRGEAEVYPGPILILASEQGVYTAVEFIRSRCCRVGIANCQITAAFRVDEERALAELAKVDGIISRCGTSWDSVADALSAPLSSMARLPDDLRILFIGDMTSCEEEFDIALKRIAKMKAGAVRFRKIDVPTPLIDLGMYHADPTVSLEEVTPVAVESTLKRFIRSHAKALHKQIHKRLGFTICYEQERLVKNRNLEAAVSSSALVTATGPLRKIDSLLLHFMIAETEFVSSDEGDHWLDDSLDIINATNQKRLQALGWESDTDDSEHEGTASHSSEAREMEESDEDDEDCESLATNWEDLESEDEVSSSNHIGGALSHIDKVCIRLFGGPIDRTMLLDPSVESCFRPQIHQGFQYYKLRATLSEFLDDDIAKRLMPLAMKRRLDFVLETGMIPTLSSSHIDGSYRRAR